MKNVISDNLKKLLEIKNITQKDLAEKLGVKLPVLNRWVTGKASPAPKSLDKLSAFFKVSVSYFYTGQTDVENSSKSDKLKDKEIELLRKENELLKKEIEILNKK